MIKLVVAAFLLLGSADSREPLDTFTHRMAFDSAEACYEAFDKTREGLRAYVLELLEAAGRRGVLPGAVVLEERCVAEDGTVLPRPAADRRTQDERAWDLLRLILGGHTIGEVRR